MHINVIISLVQYEKIKGSEWLLALFNSCCCQRFMKVQYFMMQFVPSLCELEIIA